MSGWTVTDTLEDCALTSPEPSVAVAAKIWAPSVNDAVVNDQTPCAFVNAEPSWVVPSYKVIKVLAAASPVSVNWFEGETRLLGGPLSGEADRITGALGAVPLGPEPIVKTGSGENGLVVPAGSVAVAEIACVPGASVPAMSVQGPTAF